MRSAIEADALGEHDGRGYSSRLVAQSDRDMGRVGNHDGRVRDLLDHAAAGELLHAGGGGGP